MEVGLLPAASVASLPVLLLLLPLLLVLLLLLLLLLTLLLPVKGAAVGK